jgi:hypothetical protein
MAHQKTLTEQQVSILRWVASGCPAGVIAGDSHRISAAALRRRGLVTTSGRGPTWAAEISPAGREYLARVDGRNPPVPRQANVSLTQQLVDDVIAAGGSLRVPGKRWPRSDGVDYENRVRLAERYRKVPPGKRLVASAAGDELEITLVDAPDRAAPVALTAVAVPDKVARYHPTAREFSDRTHRHEVSRALVQRAKRIVHAIATDAERREWSARTPAESEDGYQRLSWTGPKNGHLHVVADGHDFWLRVREDGVHTRGPWEEEVKRYRNVPRGGALYRDRELPSGAYDAGASGELKLELFCAEYWLFNGRHSRWSDRQAWRLEDRLPHLFREITERVIEAKRIAAERRIAAENAAAAAKRAAEEQERQWHLLMDHARERLRDANRAAHLRAQAGAWREADRLRRYCDAIEAAHGDDPDTAEWLAWARSFAISLDPLTEPPTMPEPPEATAEALQEHLPDGWSASGPQPDRRYAGPSVR